MSSLTEAAQVLVRSAAKDCERCSGTAWETFEGSKIICSCINHDIATAYYSFVDGHLARKNF